MAFCNVFRRPCIPFLSQWECSPHFLWSQLNFRLATTSTSRTTFVVFHCELAMFIWLEKSTIDWNGFIQMFPLWEKRRKGRYPEAGVGGPLDCQCRSWRDATFPILLLSPFPLPLESIPIILSSPPALSPTAPLKWLITIRFLLNLLSTKR